MSNIWFCIMALILNIETAAHTCSVALGSDGKLQAFRESHDEEYRHSEKLTEYILDVMNMAGASINDIDGVAVSKGPGSYTGLRIGVSTAKGICFATGKPLIAISTLTAMASGFIQERWKNAEYRIQNSEEESNELKILFCPMIDARRMEVFCSLFDVNLTPVMPPSALIISDQSFSEYLENRSIIFFGDGASKCRQTLSGKKTGVFITDFNMSARHLVTLSEEACRSMKFENAAYFEPSYLKDFIAGKISSPF